MVIFNTEKVKKITILGAGNAACLTALHYGFYTHYNRKFEIDLIHNPDSTEETLGQAAKVDLPNLLWDALQFNWLENNIEATINTGILYEGWGKKGDKVISPFPPNNGALHVSPKKLQDVILRSGWFTVRERDNIEYDEIDSDYIFDCRGKPVDTEDNDLYKNLTGHVNAVVLAQDSKRDLRQNWTRAIATPDGWCFSIPLFNSTSYGYLYNHKITSDETAKENFEKLFNVESEEQFHFNQYVAKKPIIDDRIILQGNGFFNLEPLETATMTAYYDWIRWTYDWLVEPEMVGFRTGVVEITKWFHEYMSKIDHFISWHYSYGSKYNTPFWEEAKRKSFDKFMWRGDHEFDTILKEIKDYSKREIRKALMDDIIPDGYAQWNAMQFKFWHDGMVSKKSHPKHYPFV